MTGDNDDVYGNGLTGYDDVDDGGDDTINGNGAMGDNVDNVNGNSTMGYDDDDGEGATGQPTNGGVQQCQATTTSKRRGATRGRGTG